MHIRGNQIITVEQAREILGDEARSMTDEEIKQLIDDLDVLAQYTIKLVQKFNKKENKTD